MGAQGLGTTLTAVFLTLMGSASSTQIWVALVLRE